MEKGNIKVSSLLLSANTLAYIVNTKSVFWYQDVFDPWYLKRSHKNKQLNCLSSANMISRHTVKLLLCANADIFPQG